MSEPQRVVYVERPRSNGCLWGCLGVLVIVALPVIAAWGFGLWSFWQGARQSPAIRTAMELVQRDGLAQRVLGTPITVTAVTGKSFRFELGSGAKSAYRLNLQGPRGDGVLDVTSHVEGALARIDALTLTGPDGQEYDLLHHVPVPSQDTPGQPI